VAVPGQKQMECEDCCRAYNSWSFMSIPALCVLCMVLGTGETVSSPSKF
jgi:hypothetical protein